MAMAVVALGMGVRHYIHAQMGVHAANDAPTGMDPESFSRAMPQRSVNFLGSEGFLDTKPLFVGIAGGTGSGKTTVASAIAERIGAGNLVHLTHDSYYRDLRTKTLQERAQVNFDHPDSLDTELYAVFGMQYSGPSLATPVPVL